MRLLRQLERARGVIERLLGNLVRAQVVLTAVMRGCNPVSVRGSLVHFSGYSMRVPRHSFPPRPAYTPILSCGYNEQTMEEQSYKKHAKFVPMFHGVLFGLIVFAFVISVIRLSLHFRDVRNRHTLVLLVVITAAMLLQFFFSRIFAMKVQDRAIRAEENFRYFVLTGKPLDHRLTIKQIVALRFASDGEFADLARKAADESLSMDDIKKSVKHWRPDYDRA
jgi:hypothetical protein